MFCGQQTLEQERAHDRLCGSSRPHLGSGSRDLRAGLARISLANPQPMEQRRFHNVVRDVFNTKGGSRGTRDEDLYGIPNHNGNLGVETEPDQF